MSGYETAINTEPIYQAQAAALAADNASSAAKRKAAIQALIAQYGGALPAGFSDPYGDVDAATLALANENPYSTLAQLKREHGFAEGNTAADEVARGTFSGGGNKLRQEDLGYKYGLGQYNALNALTQSMGGLDSNYADTVHQNALTQAGYVTDAMQRLIDAGYSPSDASAIAGGGGAGGAGQKITGNGSYGEGDAAVRAAASLAARGGAPADMSAYFGVPGAAPIHEAPGSENSLYGKSLAQRTTADANGRLPGQAGYGAKRAGGTTSNPWAYSASQLASQHNATAGAYTPYSLGTVAPAPKPAVNLGVYGR